MIKSRITQLQDSVDQFVALTGRRVNSDLLARVLAEGEYKSDMVADPIPAASSDEPTNPWFLDRRQKGEDEQDDAQPDDAEGDDRVITKKQVVEALNWVQDRGFVRSDTRRVATNANQYTFVHHHHGPIRLRVERIGEGYRMAGTHVLREFEVPPGGPMQMGSMALGQSDGEEMPLAERVQNDLIDQFEKADYRVRIEANQRNDESIMVNATLIRGKMSSYDLTEQKEMVESVILKTMRTNFPKLRPVSTPGVTGWTDGDRSMLRLIYAPTAARSVSESVPGQPPAYENGRYLPSVVLAKPYENR